MFVRRSAGATGLALACVIAACEAYAPTGPRGGPLASGDGSSVVRGRPLIRLFDNLPEPGQITIRAGTAVEWRNMGANSHSVTNYSQGEAWHDTLVEPGEGFVHVFEEPGQYGFVCIFHQEVGYVNVVPADMDTDMDDMDMDLDDIIP